jgi:hypothetical protein
MSSGSSGTSAAGGGIGLGAVIAAILSWTVNHSILWCILHAFCGWIYVIYYVLTY